MSRTFELGCDQCRVALWVGQDGVSRPFHLYTSPPHDNRLSAFLRAHQGHPLRFTNSDRAPDDWRRIDDDEPPDGATPYVSSRAPRFIGGVPSAYDRIHNALAKAPFLALLVSDGGDLVFLAWGPRGAVGQPVDLDSLLEEPEGVIEELTRRAT